MPENEFITRLVAARKVDFDALEVIVKRCEKENRAPNAAEQTEWDTRSAAVDANTARIDGIKAREASDAQTNATLERYLGPAGGNGDGGNSPSWLPNRRQYQDAVDEQRVSGFSTAGALLGVQQFNGWFDRLRNKSVVLAAGPRVIPVDGRSMSVPVLTGSATVTNNDEGSAITPSDPTATGVVLQPVAFKSLVIATNESLADSSPALQAVVADDLLKSVSTAVDVAMLVGAGGSSPRKILGLRNIVGVTTTDLGANGSLITLDALADQLAALEGAGGDPTTAAYFVSTQVWNVLRKLKATTGQYLIEPDISSAAKLSIWGVPVFPTRNLSQTETKGTATSITSTVILADMAQVCVGVGQDVQIQQSVDAYFGSDSTGIRCVSRLDLVALNPAAIVVSTGAKIS